MRELILRLLGSAVGYVGLAFMLRGPAPIREFAVYLPSSILFTLAVDRGRTELALREGASASTRRRFLGEVRVVATVGILLVAVASFVPALAGAKVIGALCVSGVLQAYVDLLLRQFLFEFRRSLYVYVFQLVLSTANLAVAAAVAFGLVSVPVAMVLFIVLPLVTVTAFMRAFAGRGEAVVLAATADPGDGPGPGKRAMSAAAFRAFPPVAYTAYAAALGRYAPELVAIARAFYFVFGFLHLRTMARESSISSVPRTATVLLGLSVITAIPLTAFGSARVSAPPLTLGVAFSLTATAAFAFALFLVRYTRFVTQQHGSSAR